MGKELGEGNVKAKLTIPQQNLVISLDVPDSMDDLFADKGSVKAAPIVAQASMPRGEWPIPLPERFKGWIPNVSTDAGTPAARERRAKEARLAMGMKE